MCWQEKKIIRIEIWELCLIRGITELNVLESWNSLWKYGNTIWSTLGLPDLESWEDIWTRDRNVPGNTNHGQWNFLGRKKDVSFYWLLERTSSRIKWKTWDFSNPGTILLPPSSVDMHQTILCVLRLDAFLGIYGARASLWLFAYVGWDL